MLLTCPNCRSGLEVPDGTTAMVRCPACKTVFAPPEPPSPKTVPARKVVRRPAEDDEDDRPRRKPQPDRRKEEEEAAEQNRDFDLKLLERTPEKKSRRVEEDETLSPRERQALRSAFARAAWGCKLLAWSLGLFMLAMMLVIAFWSVAGFSGPEPALVLAAGVVGLTSWLLAAVGVGLCLSGPPSPGHWGYGIAAAVATVLHLVLLLALVAKGNEYSPGMEAEPGGPAQKWGLIPTRLDAVTFYPTLAVYKDQEELPKGMRGDMAFSIVVGFMELLRTTLILMLLSSLARAAGDEELSHQCTRAAGFASLGPGVLAVAMFLFCAALIETRAGQSDFTQIIFTTLQMGIYAIVNGTVFAGFMAARETAEACDAPFQDRIPKV